MGSKRAGSVERRGGAYRLLEGAGPYALLQWAVGADRVQRALTTRFLEPVIGMRILDVGAGTGALRRALPECEYVALEPNRAYVEAMRAAMPEPGVTIVQGTTSDIRSVDGTFDRIVMIALLHHLDDATAHEAFRSAAAALAPGGFVVTMDNCFHSGQSLASRMLAKMDRGANVRDTFAYGALAAPYFESVELYLSTDLLRIPYSHVWVVARGAR